jgi:hypothetical protein
VSRSPAVLDVLPPLFWVEAPREGGLSGWVVEKKPGGLALKGFGIATGTEAVPGRKAPRRCPTARPRSVRRTPTAPAA